MNGEGDRRRWRVWDSRIAGVKRERRRRWWWNWKETLEICSGWYWGFGDFYFLFLGCIEMFFTFWQRDRSTRRFCGIREIVQRVDSNDTVRNWMEIRSMRNFWVPVCNWMEIRSMSNFWVASGYHVAVSICDPSRPNMIREIFGYRAGATLSEILAVQTWFEKFLGTERVPPCGTRRQSQPKFIPTFSSHPTTLSSFFLKFRPFKSRLDSWNRHLAPKNFSSTLLPFFLFFFLETHFFLQSRLFRKHRIWLE